MNYPLYLFSLLQNQRKKIEKRGTDLRSDRGFVIAAFISIAFWSLIISSRIVAI